MTSDAFAELQERLRRFAAERDWEQFHTPKNLSMALAAEVGELLELYQWATAQEAAALGRSGEQRAAIEDELADVAIYLLRLADVVGVDLASAIDAKIQRNEIRYPPDAVRGRADVPPVS